MIKAILVSLLLVSSAYAEWQPGQTWQIQYAGTLNTSLNVDVYNVDLYDAAPAKIQALKANGKKIICYLSAGSFENWRQDAGKFPAVVKGKNLDGWAGEKWLDIRRLDILMPIMEDRMDIAVHKGCDAVDPDNVDGYTNRTGFPLTYQHQITYNKAIMQAARARGLAVSLKNDLDQIKDLLPYFDFAVNEECFAYGECGLLKPAIDAGKPVFNIEYTGSTTNFCPKANSMGFSTLKKKLSLDAYRVSCN